MTSAVSSQRDTASHTSENTNAEITAAVVKDFATQTIEGDTISIRVVTPATAKHVRGSLPTFAISIDATIQQLHEQVARHLKFTANFEKYASFNECNLSFALKLSDHHFSTQTTFVIHDKSVVVDILPSVSRPTADAFQNAPRSQLGIEVGAHTKLHYFGGELDCRCHTTGNQSVRLA